MITNDVCTILHTYMNVLGHEAPHK